MYGIYLYNYQSVIKLCRSRCLAFLFVSHDLEVMQRYLNYRKDLGMINKNGRHIFVSSNPGLKKVIYSMNEFQYHGHTSKHPFLISCLAKPFFTFVGLFEIDKVACQYNSGLNCRVLGYHFDTFGSFKPRMFCINTAPFEV